MKFPFVRALSSGTFLQYNLEGKQGVIPRATVSLHFFNEGPGAVTLTVKTLEDGIERSTVDIVVPSGAENVAPLTGWFDQITVTADIARMIRVSGTGEPFFNAFVRPTPPAEGNIEAGQSPWQYPAGTGFLDENSSSSSSSSS